ncbi:MAG: hypothetical protein KDJ65_29445 [Anaerolineae bacterium]|nr:hypothetical protein [Anaerolineae bacterium]
MTQPKKHILIPLLIIIAAIFFSVGQAVAHTLAGDHATPNANSTTETVDAADNKATRPADGRDNTLSPDVVIPQGAIN